MSKAKLTKDLKDAYINKANADFDLDVAGVSLRVSPSPQSRQNYEDATYYAAEAGRKLAVVSSAYYESVNSDTDDAVNSAEVIARNAADVYAEANNRAAIAQEAVYQAENHHALVAGLAADAWEDHVRAVRAWADHVRADLDLKRAQEAAKSKKSSEI